MVRMLVDRYAAGPRRQLAAGPRRARRCNIPRSASTIRAAPAASSIDADHLPRRGAAGTVGLLLMRSYVLSGNAAHYDGVIAALEAKGLQVIPAFATRARRPPGGRAPTSPRDGAPTVDAVVSLTGFSLVGGPAYNDARPPRTCWPRLDVPYVAAHPVEFQTLGQWGATRAACCRSRPR